MPDARRRQSLPGVLAGGVYPNRWVPGADGQPACPSRPACAARRRLEARSRRRRHAGRPAPARPDIRPMIPLGQFRDTFIIAIDDEGIAIIDQHVAHERVLFERVMERLTDGRARAPAAARAAGASSCRPAARQALRRRAAELERFGFEVEEFGGDSVRVTAVPALLDAGESVETRCGRSPRISTGSIAGAHVEEALKRIAATTACHAAVKANYPLTLREDDAHPRRAAGARRTRPSARTAAR